MLRCLGDKLTTQKTVQTLSRILDHEDRLYLVGVAVVSLLIRIAHDLGLPSSPFFGSFQLDSQVIHLWALDIASGASPAAPFFRAPLYPYIVGGLYRVFGESPWTFILFQNVLGIATCLLTYIFARDLFGRTVAIGSSLIVALYPTLLFFEGELIGTVFEVFTYTLAAFTMYRAVEQPTAIRLAFSGFALGVASITRPVILPLSIFMPVCLWLYDRHRTLPYCLGKTFLYLAVVVLTIAPITLVNVLYGKEFVLISTQGGSNFFIGNSERADGVTVTAFASRVRDTVYQDNIWSTSVDEARRRSGRTLNQSEVSSFWFDSAWNQIREKPGRALALFGKKIWLFYHGQEIYNTSSLYDGGTYSPYLRATLWKNFINFPSGILFPLSLGGLLWCWRCRTSIVVPVWYLVVLTFAIAAFFVCARFRQPVIPVASIFAVVAVREWLAVFHQHAWKQMFMFLTIVIGLGIALNAGGDVDSMANHSQASMMTGCTYSDRRDYTNAIPYFEKAIEINPTNLGAYDLLGDALLKLHRLSEAEGVYRKGLEYSPSSAVFNLQLGVITLETNRCSLALNFFRQTLISAPDYLPALDRIGISFMCLGELDSALFYRSKIFSLLPPDSTRQEEIDLLRARVIRQQGKGNQR